MANDMSIWAHDIVASHKEREAALIALRKETAELLEGFRSQDAERRSEVAELLEGFRKERKRDAAAWHDILGLLHGKTKTKKEAGHGRGRKSEKSSSE